MKTPFCCDSVYCLFLYLYLLRRREVKRRHFTLVGPPHGPRRRIRERMSGLH